MVEIVTYFDFVYNYWEKNFLEQIQKYKILKWWDIMTNVWILYKIVLSKSFFWTFKGKKRVPAPSPSLPSSMLPKAM